MIFFFFFSSRRRHTRLTCDWSSDVCSSDLILSDITERKRAEEALRSSEASLVRSQQIARLGSWEWDIPANEVTWSDELHRLYGSTPDEFEASYEGFLERVHPE